MAAEPFPVTWRIWGASGARSWTETWTSIHWAVGATTLCGRHVPNQKVYRGDNALASGQLYCRHCKRSMVRRIERAVNEESRG